MIADPARISVTAKVSAYYRKFSDIAFAAEVATLVCSQVDKTPSFSTIAALDLSPAVIERMRPVLRVWLMRPVPRT